MKNYATKYIGRIITIEIDRPLGSKHENHNIYFCTNYGFIPKTKAPDGDEIDAYLLGVFEPIKKYTGKCIAVIRRKDDDDDKLIVVPKNKMYSDDQIIALTEYLERFHKVEIIKE